MNIEAQKNGRGVVLAQDNATKQYTDAVHRNGNHAGNPLLCIAMVIWLPLRRRTCSERRCKTAAPEYAWTRPGSSCRLLPTDQHANFSGLIYQNAQEALKLLSNVAPDQQDKARELAEKKTMRCCAGLLVRFVLLVLHGGRVELRRPRRRAHRVRQVRRPSLIPPALQRLRPARRGAPAAFPAQQPSAGPPQHLRALRPVQRTVRGVPRRDHDLLQRAVRHAARVPGRPAPAPSGARSTACSTPRASGPAAGCWRSARAGANCASAPRRGAHTSGR